MINPNYIDNTVLTSYCASIVLDYGIVQAENKILREEINRMCNEIEELEKRNKNLISTMKILAA